MPERPSAGATFQLEAVGRRRGRASVAALAWGTVLIGLVSIGILGHEPGWTTSATDAVADGPAAAERADAARLVPAPGDPGLIPRPVLLATPGLDGDAIHLASPGIGPVTVVTPTLTVSGTIDVRFHRVQVALVTGNDRTLEQVLLLTPSDEFRPDDPRGFRTQFDLRAPRPLGSMWIEVTVFDAGGRALGYERRQVIVGPIKGGAEPHPADAQAPSATSWDEWPAVDLAQRGDEDLTAGTFELVSPPSGPITVTAPSVRVSGRLYVRAPSLRIELESPGSGIIETLVLEAPDPSRGFPLDQLLSFQSDLTLPTPRPLGPMWVIITVYGSQGVPIGGMRRAVTVGPAGA